MPARIRGVVTRAPTPRRLGRAVAGLVLALVGCPARPPLAPPPPAPPAPTPLPRRPALANPFVSVSSRARHTCARRSTGDVLCWGKNSYGQLGSGTRRDSDRFVKVPGLGSVRDVAVGRDFSCALGRRGEVRCWGNNEDGQLGDGRGAKPGALSLRPVSAVGLVGMQALSVGHYHACAQDHAGRIWCWGNAADGQLGTDAARAVGRPVAIDRIGPVAELASGASHVCVRERTGKVKCWGRNTEGQLGDGKRGSRIKAVQVQGLHDATALVSGDGHSCAQRQGGQVVCWGDNRARQLGPAAGAEPKRHTPVPVPGVASVVQLAAGGAHTCARLTSGRIQCWGQNDRGQLGGGAPSDPRAAPLTVRNVPDAVDLALGEAHGCAIRRAGDLVCWGDPAHGALGPQQVAMRVMR